MIVKRAESKYDDNKENCPHCKVQLQGDYIPRKLQRFYMATHGSRKIGLYDRNLDRTVRWKCPDCGHEWNR